MDIKKSLAKLVLAGSMAFFGSEAKADEIKLSYDFFENKRNNVRINTIDFWPTVDSADQGGPVLSDAINRIQLTPDYDEFIASTNNANLPVDDRIRLLAFLGEGANYNYDESQPFNSVSDGRIFNGVQDAIMYRAPQQVGAICGGIHNFLRNSAQLMGFDAVNYEGVSNKKGTGHIFAMIHTKDGFVNFNYGKTVYTGTHNFYRAVVLSERNEGSSVFIHRVYDGDFLFDFVTPDGVRFFRFTDFNPSLDSLIDSFENHTPPQQGARVNLGNDELSAGYTFNESYFNVGFKGGSMFGVSPSALRRADLFQGTAGFNFGKNDSFFDARISSIYSSLNFANGMQDNMISLLTEYNFGGKLRLTENARLGLAFGSFLAHSFDLNYKKDPRYLLSYGDFKGLLSFEYAPLSAYVSAKVNFAYSDVEEQQILPYLDDIEAGILLNSDSLKLRLAHRLEREAFVPMFALEYDNFSVGLNYGVGRFGVFTPDFLEVNSSGKFNLWKNTRDSALVSSLDLDVDLSYRREFWSNDETFDSGRVQLSLRADF